MITPYSDCPSFNDLSSDIDVLENFSIDIDETMTLSSTRKQPKRKQQNK